MTLFKSLLIPLLAGCMACQMGNKPTTASAVTAPSPSKEREVPAFCADSAYRYIAEQVAFGPRVPNTEAHRNAARYLESALSRLGATVTVQEMMLRAYDGTPLQAKNIVGSFSPEKKNRILLFAHWDSRPFADYDPDEKNHRTPVMGANDGASGVGVLLEIARLIGEQRPKYGIDILFFDAEDYGRPYFDKGPDNESWALGSQYWAKQPHQKGYRAKYGILLDMVGGKDAQFHYEGYSQEFAKELLVQLWDKARLLGYGNYFIAKPGSYIMDDHLYVNQYGIESINILDYSPKNPHGFYRHWHTTHDVLENIDPKTLQAVGETLMHFLYTLP